MDSDDKSLVYVAGIVAAAIVVLTFVGKGCTESEMRTFDHALAAGCSVVSGQMVCPCK